MNDYVGKSRSGVVVILLSIVTCGIYLFYWYYTVMEDINKASGQRRMDSILLLVGTVFCPPFIWVQLYKIDKHLSRLAQENGTYYRENFTMWLLLTFLCGIGTIVAIFNICGGLNELWEARLKAMPQDFNMPQSNQPAFAPAPRYGAPPAKGTQAVMHHPAPPYQPPQATPPTAAYPSTAPYQSPQAAPPTAAYPSAPPYQPPQATPPPARTKVTMPPHSAPPVYTAPPHSSTHSHVPKGYQPISRYKQKAANNISVHRV